jgi:hypothetical protein
VSADEIRFCWEESHGCICGNDCTPLPRRCKTCGWLTSDTQGHLGAMYEDHMADQPATGWLDIHGDVWTLGEDGLLHTPETRPFSREHVEKKWGPLILAEPPTKPAHPPLSTTAAESDTGTHTKRESALDEGKRS